MPIHDWSRAFDCTGHNFHLGWAVELSRQLNRGVLPSPLYSLIETPDLRTAAGFVELPEPDGPMKLHGWDDEVTGRRAGPDGTIPGAGRFSGLTETEMTDWQDRIAAVPTVCHGKPCVRGTRILVSVVLDNLAAGLTVPEIVAEYPPLTADDVRAAIAYAADLAREEELVPLR